VSAVAVHFLTARESRWQDLKMQASGQRIEIIERHLSDGNAKLASFIFSDFACDYLTGWKPVDGKANYFVNSAEFLRVVV
jgi:hypothetical protein